MNDCERLLENDHSHSIKSPFRLTAALRRLIIQALYAQPVPVKSVQRKFLSLEEILVQDEFSFL